MLHLSFREVRYGTTDYHKTVALRETLLRKPLGLVFAPQELEKEHAHIHLAMWQHHHELLACLVMVPTGAQNVWKMRQVAVRADWQGKHIGQQLIVEAEGLASKRNINRIYLHARKPVVGFYERLGYQKVGRIFEEVGIPHQKMEKQLVRTEL